MNHESVILELMSRVQTLEQKVQVFEEQKTNYNSLGEVDGFEQDREAKITRSVARQYVMDAIKGKYGYLDVQKGNRAKQADIILTVNSGDRKGKELLGKFYYSKSFHDFPSGWHTVKESDLQKSHIDFHIFTVAYGNEFYNFIFSHDELKQFVQKKSKDSSDQYYFYFHVNEGKKTENRDGERDVQFNFENWDLFGELLM